MRKILTLFIIGAFCVPLRAQEGYEHFSVAAHGAGRTYVVTSRGLDAVGLNPALLMLPAGKQFEFRVFPVTGFGIDAGESFRDVGVLSNLFNVKNPQDFTDSSRKAIIDILRDEKLSGRGDIGVLGLAYDAGTYGAFAFTWTSHAATRTDIPQEFLDFFYTAESKLLTESGEVHNFDLQGAWYNEFALTVARQFFKSSDTTTVFQSFTAGGALKYASGIGILKLEDGNFFSWDGTPEPEYPSGGASRITANYRVLSSHINDFDPKNAPNRFSFDFLTSSEAGSGIGADVGIVIGLFGTVNGKSALKVGTSFTDIGSITWKSNAKQRLADTLTRLFVTSGTIKDLSDSLSAFEGTLTRIPEFTQPLPTMFRFGAQLDLDALGAQIWGFAPQLAFEVAQGLTDVVGSLKKPRFGIGIAMAKESGMTDYRLSGGFAIDHRSADITLGGGITLFNHAAIDIATAHLLELFSSKPRIDIAASLKVLF